VAVAEFSTTFVIVSIVAKPVVTHPVCSIKSVRVSFRAFQQSTNTLSIRANFQVIFYRARCIAALDKLCVQFLDIPSWRFEAITSTLRFTAKISIGIGTQPARAIDVFPTRLVNVALYALVRIAMTSLRAASIEVGLTRTILVFAQYIVGVISM
jgi:hypothetical protein